jgi:putative MATE family efflux protein
MQMMSAGAVGGGISAAVARTLGAGRRPDADALAVHALAIALILGLAFMLAMLGGGRWVYPAMGGSGASLSAALAYSNVVFGGAILVWLFNSLASVIRGTGNMAVPAIITGIGVVALIPLSPCLIFGWGPVPRLGVAGGAVAVVAFYAVGSVALAGYLWSGRSVVRPALHGAGFRRLLFRDILRVGAVAALITVQTNLTIAITTAIVGRLGSGAIAGYGIGSRLEYLLVPLIFGLGGPLVAMVGTSIGANRREQALRTAWIGGAIAAGLSEVIGLCAAAFPRAWLALFDTDPTMIEAGSDYFRTVGPFYGFFGPRHGPLFCLARRRTAAVAVAGQLHPLRCLGRRRLACIAIDRRADRCLCRPRCGADRLWFDECRQRRRRCLVRSTCLAAAQARRVPPQTAAMTKRRGPTPSEFRVN